MVTLHEVITFLVSMQISISSFETHNVNRCGRTRHLARKLCLRRKRSSPNVFEMAAMVFIFFFQAEDGIRDLTVTGVQTCALPIWHRAVSPVAPKVVITEIRGDLEQPRLEGRVAQGPNLFPGAQEGFL